VNTLVALMIVTATGVVEAPNNFNSMQECQDVVLKLKAESYCVVKKPVDAPAEIKKMMSVFKQMVKEME
jgi:hypothetical protein